MDNPSKPTVRVRVLRPFHISGSVSYPGSVLELPRALGAELVGANKAERVADDTDLHTAPAPARAAVSAQVARAATKVEAAKVEA